MADIALSAAAGVGKPRTLFPPLTAATLVTSLFAGIAADLTWEVWARLITPLLPGVGGPLEPAALVQSVFGLESRSPEKSSTLSSASCSIRSAISSSRGRCSGRSCPDCRGGSPPPASASGSGSSRST